MAVLKFRNLTTGQATPVPTGEFTVGREDSAYVHVDDASVSRQHARIVNQDDGFYVEDLGSINGTAARGSLIRGRVKVEVGETIYIGSVPFRVDPEVGGKTEPEAAPSAGMRVVNRAYMRKNTQRIVLPMETPPATGAFASGKIAEKPAPEKMISTVVEAQTIPEPVEPPVRSAHVPEPPPPSKLPIIRPGTRPEVKGETARRSVTLPVAPDLDDSRPVPKQKSSDLAPVSSLSRRETVAVRVPENRTIEESENDPVTKSTDETPVSGVRWERFLLIFLAGVVVGLLAGLYFAKVFIEMGGKAGALP